MTVEYPPPETQKNHAGDLAEAADLKNKFLQDVDGPTFHHFSYGPSLNRTVLFQDHVGVERGSYVFNSVISVSF